MLFLFAFDYVSARYIFSDVYFRALTSCWFLEYHAVTDIDGNTVNVPESICASVYMSVHMSPHMDMGGSDHGPDYSDYEYQWTHASVVKAGPPANSNQVVFFEIEPLAGIGGLSVNEVAELVYLNVEAVIETEEDTGDQDVASSTEFRGVLGINTQSGEFLTSGTTSAVIGGNASLDEDASSAPADVVNFGMNNQVRDEFLDSFQIAGGPGFDDETNGPGGNQSSNLYQREINYRELTGRGPVIDSNDALTLNTKLVTADSVVNESGVVRIQAIWDTAEVDDAGRAFSVPDGM